MRHVLLGKEVKLLSVALAVMAAKQMSLTHAFRCEHAFSDSKLLDLVIIERCSCSMSDQLKDKQKFFVWVADSSASVNLVWDIDQGRSLGHGSYQGSDFANRFKHFSYLILTTVPLYNLQDGVLGFWGFGVLG